MVYNRPCKDGKHDINQVFGARFIHYECRNCPIRLSETDLRNLSTFAPNEGAYVNAVRRAWVNAERDWYIKELES